MVKEKKELDGTDKELLRIENRLSKKFSEGYLKLFRRLAYEISIVGLSEEESCLVVGIDYVSFKALKKKENDIERLFEMKHLEYKRGLMLTLSNKARSGDDKLAQWLLAAKYPEFNKKKGSGSTIDNTEDLLGAAIEFIQDTNDNKIIGETSGESFIRDIDKKERATFNIHNTLTGRTREIVEQMERDNI